MSALRQPYYELSAEAMQGLLATKAALERGPLGKTLVELLYLRVSQINGCAFCLENTASHCVRRACHSLNWTAWPVGE
ncbi:carboxymuconolactone decarboxylase family protein [Ectopseudomonas mendocina]|uniref:carboxymuconolactone decarboxylase family protein n=1 Tax=Ectopseudomonas mendocina TaxID=300 RepID=UPI000B217046